VTGVQDVCSSDLVETPGEVPSLFTTADRGCDLPRERAALHERTILIPYRHADISTMRRS
jgi:hypothetical protein